MLNDLLRFDGVRRIRARLHKTGEGPPPKAEVALRRYEALREDARQYTVQLVQLCALFVTVIGAIIGLSLQAAVQWRTTAFTETYRDLVRIEADSQRSIFGSSDFALDAETQQRLADETDKSYQAFLEKLSFLRLVTSPAIVILISLAIMVSSVVVCTAVALYAQIAIRRHEARLMERALRDMGFTDALDHRAAVHPLWFAFHHFVAVVLLVDMLVVGAVCGHVVPSPNSQEGAAVPAALALALTALYAATRFAHCTLGASHDMNMPSTDGGTRGSAAKATNWCHWWSLAFWCLSIALEVLLVVQYAIHHQTVVATFLAGTMLLFDCLSYQAVAAAIRRDGETTAPAGS